jgi:hypothetical protein
MKIWTQDGVCRKTIDRRRIVGSVTWLQTGEGDWQLIVVFNLI